MKRLIVAGLLVVSAFLLGGCASSMSGSAYSRDQAQQAQTVEMGTVEAVRQVQIEGTKTPIGAAAGAVVGGVGGSNVGKGSGSTVGAVLGAVGGGLLGAAAEEGLTRKTGLEITVRLDSGRIVAIVQEADEPFNVRERVRVVTGNDGISRVSH